MRGTWRILLHRHLMDRKVNRTSQIVVVCSWTLKTELWLSGSLPQIFHFLGDGSGIQTPWQRDLQVMGQSKGYLAWIKAAHVFLPMCPVMLNQVFANPAEPLSLQRTLCLCAVAPAPRQLGLHLPSPGARPTPGRAERGGAVGRVPRWLTQHTRNRKGPVAGRQDKHIQP